MAFERSSASPRQASRPLRLTLELSSAGEPVEGNVDLQGSDRWGFAGWIELIAVLQKARSDTERRVKSCDGPRTKSGNLVDVRIEAGV